MTLKRPRPSIPKSRLEKEVILAVILLYLMISGALLAIHHLQPEGTVTQTSSPSPSHAHFATPPVTTEAPAANDAPKAAEQQP